MADRFIQIDGQIHVVLDSEHVLCHTATFDAADSEEDESLRWWPTTKTVVTCEACARIVMLCKGVRCRAIP